MAPLLLFGISIALSFLAWGAVCRGFVWPRIRDLPLHEAARRILPLHLFRFVGTAFLIPGVVGPELPTAFSAPAAYGDLAATGLAWLALVLGRHPFSRIVLWVFNVWGTFDLLLAFYHGLFGVGIQPGSLGAAYFIPTVLVPLLLCTHVMLLCCCSSPRVIPIIVPLDISFNRSRRRKPLSCSLVVSGKPGVGGGAGP